MLALAYVHHGRWIARCPFPSCPGAECAGRDDDGRIGGLSRETFRCAHCLFECDAQWPHNPADIEYLLSLRPVPATRNWLPSETVNDLLKENFMHGITPLDGPLRILADHVVGLSALAPGQRLAIGGE